MRNIIIYIIIILNITSCKLSQKHDHNEYIQNSIKNMEERNNYYIPDSLFSFFPNISLDQYRFLGKGMIQENAEKTNIRIELSEFVPSVIIETYKVTDNRSLQKLILQYKTTAINIKRTEEFDYFIIGSERKLLNKYNESKLKHKYLSNIRNVILYDFGESFKRVTIPLLYDSTTICGLPKGYEVLTIKTGNKYVLPQKYKYNWNILPDQIKHGYRSGVAFNENEPYIIYWVVAW